MSQEETVGQPVARTPPAPVWSRIGLLAACAIAEGIYLILPGLAVGAGFVLVGALVPLVFARSRAGRRRAYLAVIPAIALGGLGYMVFLAVANLTAGV